MNKQIFAVFLLLILTLVLCGCNENKNDPQENNNQNRNSDTNEADLEIVSYEVYTYIWTTEEEPGVGLMVGDGYYYSEEGFIDQENDSYYEVAGIVKNNDNQAYVNVKVIASFYDLDNVFLRNVTDDIWLIAVGEEKDFSLNYENSYDYFDQVESVKLEVYGTIWSDASSDRVVDGELSESDDGSSVKWTLLSLTNDEDYCYLLDDEGKNEFSMQKYGDFVNEDHVYITGEYVELPSVFYAVKIDSISLSTTPIIAFEQDTKYHKITIESVESSDILWSDISITGDCNTSALGEYIDDLDIITECSGNIIIEYKSNKVVLADYEFEGLDFKSQSYVANGNISIMVIGGSALDPANARIDIGIPPNFGLTIYDPEPFESIGRNTKVFLVINPETGEPVSDDGHSYYFEWKDKNGNEKIDIGDELSIYDTDGLYTAEWQVLIYHRYVDIILFNGINVVN